MSSRRQQRKRCQLGCAEHVFSISKYQGPSKYDQQLVFCPKYQRDPLPAQQTHAIFNKDMKYYTSGFILGVDRRGLQESLQQQLMSHNKMVKDSLQKNNQICFPRPNTKNPKQPNCSVCKTQYINYYHHISSNDHKDAIHSNIYNSYILELCQNYKQLWEGAQQKADLYYEELDKLEKQREEAGELESQQKQQREEINSKLQDDEVEDQCQQNQNEVKSIQSKSKNNSVSSAKQNEFTIKRSGAPLLCDLISKKIIVSKGQTIKPVFTKTKETSIQQIQKNKQSQKVSFAEHRGKYFLNKSNQQIAETNHKIKDRQQSLTVVKSKPEPSLNVKHFKDPTNKKNIKLTNQTKNIKPLEPYYEYIKKIQPENQYHYKEEIRQNYPPRHPTHPYELYPPWSYPPYYYPPPHLPITGDSHPQSHKNPYMGNTSININFPMYVPPYHTINYPRYPPYPLQYSYPPYPTHQKKPDQPPPPI